MGLGLRILGEGRSLDLHITHNLCPLAKELGVYEAIWQGGLFVEETITTSKGSRSVWTVSDEQLALIDQAIVRIESGNFLASDFALEILQEIKNFCCDENQIIDVCISR